MRESRDAVIAKVRRSIRSAKLLLSDEDPDSAISRALACISIVPSVSDACRTFAVVFRNWQSAQTRMIKMHHSDETPGIATLLRSDHRYKYLDSFITLFVVILLISNIVASKFFAVGPLRVSVAQILFPITYIFGDIFTEVYGYGASRRAIWYGFFASFVLVTISFIAVKIPPAPEYKDQSAFATIFAPVGRIVAASLIAYWCGEFANSFTLAKMKLVTKGKYLWTRTIGSTVVGQAVDTTIVMAIIFYREPVGVIARLIVSGYLIKVIYESIMTPVTYAIVSFLKRTEGVDYFDYATNFNPFATEN